MCGFGFHGKLNEFFHNKSTINYSLVCLYNINFWSTQQYSKLYIHFISNLIGLASFNLYLYILTCSSRCILPRCPFTIYTYFIVLLLFRMKMYFAGTQLTVVFIEAKETIKICIIFLLLLFLQLRKWGVNGKQHNHSQTHFHLSKCIYKSMREVTQKSEEINLTINTYSVRIEGKRFLSLPAIWFSINWFI